MNRFEGRVAFVTGAGHGIGRATVHRLAREGASVAVADIDDEAARGVAEVVTSAGGQAFAITCDVTNVASVDAAVAACAERFGHLDVLVQTAGGDTEEPAFHDTPDAVWQRMVDLNLLGTVRCIRSAIPHLLPSAFGGCVVMIGSVNGLSAFGSFPYSSAKAGLGILTKNLAAEYGHQGVRFNLIAPGTIRTRVWDSQPASLERLARLYPLGRVGEPDDIAAAVAFLASDDAAWITGVTLPVEGGILTGPRAMLTGRDD
jgi:NAD(P)-dependent dehydrogenase (short-subunit alcohol dehydrogenase family)